MSIPSFYWETVFWNEQVARLNPERSIPPAVLKGAKGLAILTVAKAGMVVAYKLGSGLVVARRSDGSWSAPSAIFSVGLGWGAQVSLASVKRIELFCTNVIFIDVNVLVISRIIPMRLCTVSSICYIENKRDTVKERKCINEKCAI